MSQQSPQNDIVVELEGPFQTILPPPVSCSCLAKGREPAERLTSSKKCPSVKVSWTRNAEDSCQVRCSTRHCSTRNVLVTMSPSKE